MNKLALSFDAPRARKRDPQTSHDAAVNAAKFAATHAGRILAALKAHGPMAPCQMARFTGLDTVKADRRLPEMKKAGLVEVVMLDGKPMTHDGCRVWKAC